MAVKSVNSATETTKQLKTDIVDYTLSVCVCDQCYRRLPKAGIPYGQQFCRQSNQGRFPCNHSIFRCSTQQ